jgi:hypothetical protein
MTTLTLPTYAQASEMTAKQLRPLLQEAKIPGAWKMNLNQLRQVCLEYDQVIEVTEELTHVNQKSQVTEELTHVTEANTQVTDFILVSDPKASTPTYYGPTLETPNTPQELLRLNPTATEVAKQPKAKKSARVIEELTHVTEADLQLIEDNIQVTATSCSDPNKSVIKRTVIAQIIQDHTDIFVAEKVMNQLVVIASRKLPRQKMTIQSASRFRYLLAQPQKNQKFSPALLVLDWILAHPEAIQEAAHMYQDASQTGLEYINEYLKG